MVVRAALSRDSKILEMSELKDLFRDNKNRAKQAGIVDVGTFAACRGYDAFYVDDAYLEFDERVYVVVNRGALMLQKMCLQRPR